MTQRRSPSRSCPSSSGTFHSSHKGHLYFEFCSLRSRGRVIFYPSHLARASAHDCHRLQPAWRRAHAQPLSGAGVQAQIQKQPLEKAQDSDLSACDPRKEAHRGLLMASSRFPESPVGGRGCWWGVWGHRRVIQSLTPAPVQGSTASHPVPRPLPDSVRSEEVRLVADQHVRLTLSS